MISVKIQVGKRTYRRRIPERFEEMTRRQVVEMARVMILRKVMLGQWTDNDKIFMICVLLRIKLPDFYRLGENAIITLLEQTRNIFTDQAYPRYKYLLVGGSKLYLPDYNMQSSPFIEFVFAEEYFQNLQEGAAIGPELNGLTTALCRPGKLFSKKRKKFDSDANQQLMTKMQYGDELLQVKSLSPGLQKVWNYVPYEEKFCVLMYYWSVRNNLRQLFPSCFTTPDGAASRSTIDYTSKYRWRGMLSELAKEGTFGNWDRLIYTNLHNVLHHVSYNADKYREFELKNQVYGSQYS